MSGQRINFSEIFSRIPPLPSSSLIDKLTTLFALFLRIPRRSISAVP
jgi:hypothetical protein